MKKHKNGDISIISLYVDDLIITCRNKELITEFKKKMMQEFKMTDLEFLNCFLELKFIRVQKKSSFARRNTQNAY